MQALEGLLSLGASNENLHERQILNSEISRLKNLVAKYNLPTIKQPESTGSLAKKVGLESEHKALFKLFSKLVHPSSFLVNDYANASSNENQMILQIYAQLYGTDSIERICKALNIPKEISKPYRQA